jgi:hypothetical protein
MIRNCLIRWHNVSIVRERSIEWAETSGILPSATYFTRELTDHVYKKEEYFKAFTDHSCKSPFLFFDPDIGPEIPSKPRGQKDSRMYLYWDELTRFYRAGHSVLVYQHFPRKDRLEFMTELATKTFMKTNAPEILLFQTDRVVFLLLTQKPHLPHFHAQSRNVTQVWQPVIEAYRFQNPRQRTTPVTAT